MKKLELRNDALEMIGEMLLSIPLKGTTSRMRTRFVDKINGQIEEVRKEHYELIKDYSVLDENNNPIIEDDNYKIKSNEIEEFNQAYADLYSEFFTIEVDKENRKMLEHVLIALDEMDALAGEKAVIHYYAYEEIEKSLK